MTNTVAINLPVLTLKKIGIDSSCYRITRRKKNRGSYFNDKQRVFMLRTARRGKDKLPDILAEAMTNEIVRTDIAIVFVCKKSRSGNTWYDAYLLDDVGVRMHFTAAWLWTKVKAPKVPFSKENYHDTALRRREQSAGEIAGEQHFLFKGVKIKFRREAANG